jgi:hypothetical protein
MQKFLLPLFLLQSTYGLQVRSYSSTLHDRFLAFPSAPAANPDFIYSDVDLTGVGWYIAPSNTAVERRRQFTLISPKHFVGAYHFRPSANGSLSFLAGDGVVRTYAIESLSAILNSDGEPSDLVLGTLDTEVGPNEGINFQPFLSLPEAGYTGQELIFMGHRRPGTPTLRAGRAIFQARSQFGEGTPIGANTGIKRTEVFSWTYQENSLLFTGNVNDSFTEGGDSGSPSLANVDGRGAIVGIHTAAGTASVLISSQNISYDTFVPFYVDQINEKTATAGYHMTRAVPGANKPMTTLAVSIDAPETIRAGYPVDLGLEISNTGLSEVANNIKLSQTLPAASGQSASGPLWITSFDGNDLVSRKGGLPVGTSSEITLTFIPSNPGVFTSEVTFSADEFSESKEEAVLNVIGSYRSWSAGLARAGTTADSDGDTISNLQEYAFGGNPEISSVVQEGNGEVLLPFLESDSGGRVFTFLRRTDASERALTYVVETSPDLSEESWETFSGEMTADSPILLGNGFERVRVEFPDSDNDCFFRLKVSLDE